MTPRRPEGQQRTRSSSVGLQLQTELFQNPGKLIIVNIMLIFLCLWMLEKYQMFIVLIVLDCTAQRGVDSRRKAQVKS